MRPPCQTTALLTLTLLLVSPASHADSPPQRTPAMPSATQLTCCQIDDQSVSAARFDAFLRELTMIPGTQLSGESPRGLYSAYKARAANGKRYLIRIDGSLRSAQQLPE